MENGHYFKEYAKYTFLNVMGMIGLSCYILADTFFISKGLGANGLAALNLAIPVYSFVHGSGLMLGIGGATRYSICLGQGQRRHTDAAFTHTVQMAGILALIFIFTGIFLSGTLTSVLGADKEIFSMTNIYIRVILLFSPAFMMNDILICFVRNDGNPRLSMLAMLGGSFSNILFDYIFIFPMHLGIFGAVLATGFAPVVSISFLSRHWIKKKNGFHFRKIRLHFSAVQRILSLGFPSLIAEVSSGIVIIVFNIIILGLQGNVGVAAYGVIANLSLVVVSVYTGIAQGIQPLISRSYGCGDKKNIRLVLRYSMVTMAALSFGIYLAMFFLADPIAGIFNSEQNAKLQAIAVYGLKLYFTAVIFVGFNIIISVHFTSTDNALPAHIISLLRGLVLIVPAAFLLSAFWGITGVWLAFPITEFLVAVLGVGMYRRLRRKLE